MAVDCDGTSSYFFFVHSPKTQKPELAKFDYIGPAVAMLDALNHKNEGVYRRGERDDTCHNGFFERYVGEIPPWG